MGISLFDISIPTYIQVLNGVEGCLKKGRDYFEANGVDLEEIVNYRIHPDMLPLRFQLVSVMHHSLNSIRGIQNGLFEPPPSMPDLNYMDLQNLVVNSRDELAQESRESIDDLLGKPMVFRLGEKEIPFKAENFVMSFSIPNLLFHATTAYSILRANNVPLSKLDFMGTMRIGY